MEVTIEEVLKLMKKRIDWYITNQKNIKSVQITYSRNDLEFKIEMEE